jgi:PAS domain S-box-containing protein
LRIIGLFITNSVDRRLVAGFLEQSGHTICAATPDDDCLEKMEAASLVITDEAAARALGKRLIGLRRRSGAAYLPLLVLLPQSADSAAWLRAGFDDVLRFPITRAEMAARVTVFLRLRDHSAEHYRDLFENALIGIYRTTPEGRILMANPALVRMLGYPSFEELARQNLEEGVIVSKQSRSGFKQRVESEGQVVGAESSWARQDGSALFVRETARAILDESGKALFYEGTVEDITERKRAEQERDELLSRERAARAEAETANRAKDEFLATVSHELRTPLNSMLGWARMLRGAQLDEPTFKRGLETIERNARSQAQIIEDILDVSRIVTGKLKLEVRPVELEPIIQAAMDASRPAAEAKGIQIRARFDTEAGPVLGDPIRLQQVLWNLISNAVKFTPKGGRVDIWLARADSYAQIGVADTGRGINRDFLPYVFDRFRQADSSSTRQYGGLGLGLAIARHLVEMHGGTIQVESPGDGQGATFTVEIPLMSARTDATGLKPAPYLMKDEASSICPPELRGLRVAVVDDDADTLEMITTALEQCEMIVTTARSAEEVIEALRRMKPDVLISDIGMPGEDGYALIKRVKDLERDRRWSIPAIALTAFASDEDRERALSSGFQAHLAKPVHLDELITAIAALTVGGGDRMS